MKQQMTQNYGAVCKFIVAIRLLFPAFEYNRGEAVGLSYDNCTNSSETAKMHKGLKTKYIL